MIVFSEAGPIGTVLRDLTEIETHQSAVQSIKLFHHTNLGKVLVIDGEVQHIEASSELYHEPLIHLPASFIPTVKSCLIIGGGSLYAAAEILKYKGIESVLLVDHDQTVVDLMRRHYHHARTVWNDNRFRLLEQDAVPYILDNQTPKFDLVINDCFDLNLLSESLGTNLFIRLAALTNASGICADVTYRSVFFHDLQKTASMMRDASENTKAGLICVPEYPGSMHVLTMWGGGVQTSNRLVNSELQSPDLSRFNFRFFDPRNLNFFLYLPPSLRRIFC